MINDAQPITNATMYSCGQISIDDCGHVTQKSDAASSSSRATLSLLILGEMSFDITAHQYNVDSSSPSSFHILETARKVVDAATSTSSEWHSIAPPSKSAPNSSSSGSCFVWAGELPVIHRGMGATPGGAHELYGWDAPVEDYTDVIISLPEFEGTDFRDIISHPKSRFTKRPHPSDSTPHGRRNITNNVDVNADTRSRKRFCPQCESHASASSTISISKLIPLVCDVNHYSHPIVSHSFTYSAPLLRVT